MEIIGIIINTLPYIFTAVVLIAGTAAMIANEKRNVKEWLLFAVAKAEKVLGSGTGQIKLRAVYQAFVSRFGAFARLVPFEVFSKWVDSALAALEAALADNEKLKDYIGGESNGDIHG